MLQAYEGLLEISFKIEYLCALMGSPGVSVVKNPPAMQVPQETWVQSLGTEDPLEEEMATHSGILARIISWTEEPGGLESTGSQSVRHDPVTEHLGICFDESKPVLEIYPTDFFTDMGNDKFLRTTLQHYL